MVFRSYLKIETFIFFINDGVVTTSLFFGQQSEQKTSSYFSATTRNVRLRPGWDRQSGLELKSSIAEKRCHTSWLWPKTLWMREKNEKRRPWNVVSKNPCSSAESCMWIGDSSESYLIRTELCPFCTQNFALPKPFGIHLDPNSKAYT